MSSLGELAVKCGQYHDMYTRPLLASAGGAGAGGGGGVLAQHFSGVFFVVLCVCLKFCCA